MSSNGNETNSDLFIAFCVFLPLATCVSATSIGSNIWLLRRQALFRREQLQGRRLARRQDSIHGLQWFVKQYVFHRDEQKHREQTSSNDIELRQFYLAMMLLLLEVRWTY